MNNGSTLLNSTAAAHWQAPPGPRFLVEREPAYLIFLGNLVDLIRHPPSPRGYLQSLTPLRRDVFIPAGSRWWAFLESGLWHMIAVLALLIISQGLGPQVSTRRADWHRSHISYYRPNPTFPALGGRPPALARRERKLEFPHAIRVPREAPARREPLVAPPDIAALTKTRELPKALGSTAVAPAMPLAAIPGMQRETSQMGATVIGPPPDVKAAGARPTGGLQMVAVAPAPVVGGGVGRRASSRTGGLQATVIAPAPQVAAVSGRSGIAGPKVGAVAPPPTLQGGSLGLPGKIPGDGNLLHVIVVPPAPELPTKNRVAVGRGGTGGTGTGLDGAGAAVVPPPPDVVGSGARRGSGQGRGALGTVAAVPPAPSVGGAGGLSGPAGRGLGDGSGAAVVPPPPSFGGTGSVGDFGGRGHAHGSGYAAVPPPPSMDGTGRLGGAGGRDLAGGLASVVPPAPSMEGTGASGGRGDGSSLGDSITSVVPPPPSVDDAGEANADQSLDNTTIEIPMRIVGLAFALPGTSFSSSYEVFIAEKEFSGHKVQLIKLVYWFLPYQTRLSEYHPDASKIYKLRVTRDHECDESLEQMTVPPSGQVYSGSRLPADSLPLGPHSRNMVLPCYRTTADDYRKAAGRR